MVRGRYAVDGLLAGRVTQLCQDMNVFRGEASGILLGGSSQRVCTWRATKAFHFKSRSEDAVNRRHGPRWLPRPRAPQGRC
jgi:hypothetical protein